jgi:hypothetical protein
VARIRTIKPDFWTDEKIVELDFATRLFFVGSWNFADDNGNLQRSAKKLKMQIFPADAIDCEPIIQSLMAHGLLSEYEVNGDKFLHINGFRKHQVINRPSKTGLPCPDSCTAHEVLTDDSLTEGKGREGKGKEEEGGESTVSGSREAVSPTIPNPPTCEAHWASHFRHVHGIEINPSSVHDRKKAWPIFAGWVNARLTLERVDAAVGQAQAQATETIAFLPGYVDRVIASQAAPKQTSIAVRDQERADVIATLTGRKSANECTPETFDVAARRVD